MKRIFSEEYFCKEPEDLNCAQSIMKGFQEEFQIPDEIIERFRAFGGGRATDGICGALYSANFLMKRRGLNTLDDSFKEKVHTVKCEEIKQKGVFTCAECVEIADRLLEAGLKSKD